MFIGEAVCLIVFHCIYCYYQVAKKKTNQFGSQKFSPFIFFFPACCDALATSLVYAGLIITFASSFQMLHSSVIIFTSLLSVTFLGSILHLYHWLGMFIVILGSIVISLGDVIEESGSNVDTNSILTGNLLIITAQLVNGIQMVIEERYVKGYNIPLLQGVGWEGMFGLFIISIVLIPMYFILWHLPSGSDFWQDHTRFEDPIDAFHQIFYIPTLTLAFFGNIISIALLILLV